MVQFRLPLPLVAAMVLCAEVSAQEPANVRSRLIAALGSGVELTAIATDSSAPSNVEVWRATGFRCLDCSPVHVTLLVRAPDSLLVRDVAGLSRAWRLLGFRAPQTGAELRAQIIKLLRITCLPGCGAQIVSQTEDLDEAFRVFLLPTDSLRQLAPPTEQTHEGRLETRFFVRSAEGVDRVLAVFEGGGLALRVQSLATFQRS